jgi:hypothetical protein
MTSFDQSSQNVDQFANGIDTTYDDVGRVYN